MSLRGILKSVVGLFLLFLLTLVFYAGKGYADALSDSPALKLRAQGLIAHGHGSDDLTQRKLNQFLEIEDPAFWKHNGVDLETKGAGFTTITQSLSKRLAFEQFKPGLRKIRQTTYALGLEKKLSKREILALFFDSAELGNGPTGWMTGMFGTSQQIYGKPPADLTDHEWLRLVAVGIAPKQFNLLAPDEKLAERVRRIERLLSGKCKPQNVRDVWLQGCALNSAG